MTGAELACPSCRAAVDEGQEYCLQCGARVVRPEGPASRLGRAWRRRFRRYPGDWIWPALLLAAVAAGGAAAAIAATGERKASGSATQPIVATTTLRPAPPLPAKPRKARRARPRAPERGSRPERRLVEWTAERAYTVVLATLPESAGLARARAKAREALAARLPQVGILVSAEYASLHPGYYVVFSGVYRTLEEAQGAVARAAGPFPNAYARQVTR